LTQGSESYGCSVYETNHLPNFNWPHASAYEPPFAH
jgi:hypothetical protein